MKYFLLITTVLASLSFSRVPKINCIAYKTDADTSKIIHLLDGSTTEWPDTLFQTDKETAIRYAVDNDAQHLFLALRIADFRTEMKLMRQGMNLFIDLKGKKKENTGIEFPIKRENGEGFSGSGFSNQQGNQQNQEGNVQRRNIDKKAMRESMALNMIAMKLFGFTDAEPARQGLQMEGSAKIDFMWDSSDVMHIEYFIPLSMLGNVASLNQKTISLGWKINAAGSTSGNGQSFTTTTIQSRPSGSGGGSRNTGRGGGGNLPGQADMEKMTTEQKFWTKYMISL